MSPARTEVDRRSEIGPGYGALSRRRVGVAVLVFALVFLAFNLNLRKVGAYDTIAASLLPFNILQGRGLVLDKLMEVYGPTMMASVVRSRTGHAISFYPVVTPMLVTPLYLPWVISHHSGSVTDIGHMAPLFEKFAASALVAAAVLAVFLLLERVTTRRIAVTLTAAFAFGTSTWSISSQALWQHGTAELLLALSLLLLAKKELNAFRLISLGITAGLLTANRPVDLFFSIAIAAVVLRRTGLRAWPFGMASAAIAALWIGYNTTHFHSFIGGYGDWRSAEGKPVWMTSGGTEGIFGVLFSNRGLLVFSPFLILFFVAPRAALTKYRGLGVFLLAFLAFLYFSARTPDWAGGYAYGPRLLTDGLPVLVLAITGPLENLRHVAGRIFFWLSLGFSVTLQVIGVFFFPGGDSGNENLGLWNLKNSSPVVAFRAGLQSPHFAYVFFPSLCVRDRLPAGVAARYEWASPVPPNWRAREMNRVAVKIRNDSSARWSSWGGWLGMGAVRISAYWRGAANGPSYASDESDFWLTASLPPGSSVTRNLSVRAPNVLGRFRLCLELSQINYGRFSDRGIPSIMADIQVEQGPPKPDVLRAVEWAGGEGPQEIHAGGEANYRVGIRNLSNTPWSKAVSVAYHWRRLDGPYALWDGERTQIPEGRSDPEQRQLTARVVANVSPATYHLEFDLLEEGVAWFSHRGSPPLVLEVKVVP